MLNNSKGFSLIEILISLVLFTALSLSMMNVLKQTTRAQDQMEKLIKKNRIRTNISYAIRKDLQTPMMVPTDSSYQAYQTFWHYLRDPNRNNGKVESDYITSHLNHEGYYNRNFIFPVAGFIGNEQSFYFTNAHPRLKVGYALENCPSSNSRCLIRKTAPIDDKALDEFPESDTQSTPLLEGVDELDIQYLNARNREWTETFNIERPTNFYSFPLTFPLAVKMDITLENSDPLSLSIPIYPSILSHKIHTPTKVPKMPETTQTNQRNRRRDPSNPATDSNTQSPARPQQSGGTGNRGQQR